MSEPLTFVIRPKVTTTIRIRDEWVLRPDETDPDRLKWLATSEELRAMTDDIKPDQTTDLTPEEEAELTEKEDAAPPESPDDDVIEEPQP